MMDVERLGDALSKPQPVIKSIISSGILIEEGKAVLYGVFKSGKSTLLQYIGLCCAGGLPLFGNPHFRTEQSIVFYLQLEMPYKAFLKRVRDSSLSAVQEVQQNFHMATEFWLKLDTSDGLEKLERVVYQLHPDLVIIDPFYKTISGSENSVEDITRFCDNLDLLMSRYHFALIFSAQGRKTQILPKVGKVDMGDEELRGSTAIPGWVDSIFGLRYAGDTKRTLSFTLRHGDKESFFETIEYDRKTGLYRTV